MIYDFLKVVLLFIMKLISIKIKVNFYKIVHIPIKAMIWTAF